MHGKVSLKQKLNIPIPACWKDSRRHYITSTCAADCQLIVNNDAGSVRKWFLS
jgi:hypothetical protein